MPAYAELSVIHINLIPLYLLFHSWLQKLLFYVYVSFILWYVNVTLIPPIEHLTGFMMCVWFCRA